MDLVLHIADEFLLDSVWARLVPLNDPLADLPPGNASTAALHPQSAWPRDHIPRQLLSLIVVTLIGIHLLYFIFAGLSFQFIFNHDMMRHPRFLKNQIKLEIQCSLKAFPGMALLTLPWFQAEVMGYSRLYDDVSEYGWLYLVLSVPLYVSFIDHCPRRHISSFLVFTDYLIYWVHRTLHHPMLYKTFHKPHHKWLSTSSWFLFSLSADILSPSTDPLRIPCIPSCGRIFAVRAVPSLHILVPPPAMAVLGSLCVCQLLEHICMIHILSPRWPS